MLNHDYLVTGMTRADKFILLNRLRLSKLPNGADKLITITGSRMEDTFFMKHQFVIPVAVDPKSVVLYEKSRVVLQDLCHLLETIMHGRNIYENIRKYVQFQLTWCLNLAIYTFVCILKYGQLPFDAPIFVWLNLVNYIVAAMFYGPDLPNRIIHEYVSVPRNEFREDYHYYVDTDNCNRLGNSILHNTEPFDSQN